MSLEQRKKNFGRNLRELWSERLGDHALDAQTPEQARLCRPVHQHPCRLLRSKQHARMRGKREYRRLPTTSACRLDCSLDDRAMAEMNAVKNSYRQVQWLRTQHRSINAVELNG